MQFFSSDYACHRYRDKLKSQGRMNFILANLDKMKPEDLDEIRDRAATFLA